MAFDEAIRAVTALTRQDVEVRLYGREEGGGPFATLAGVLDRSPEVQLPAGLKDAAGSPVAPKLGDPIGTHPANELSVSPERFVSAIATDSPEGVEITTKDAVIHVLIPRPWID